MLVQKHKKPILKPNRSTKSVNVNTTQGSYLPNIRELGSPILQNRSGINTETSARLSRGIKSQIAFTVRNEEAKAYHKSPSEKFFSESEHKLQRVKYLRAEINKQYNELEKLKNLIVDKVRFILGKSYFRFRNNDRQSWNK